MLIAMCIRNLTIVIREMLYAYYANTNTFLGCKPFQTFICPSKLKNTNNLVNMNQPV